VINFLESLIHMNILFHVILTKYTPYLRSMQVP
jgi:hypothetical protein